MINLRRINLNLLTFFEALYQEQNLTAAAERINVSQPAMSNALARLRAVFNDQLFIRIGHKMEPTPRAKRLAPSILEALSRVREGLEDSDIFDPSVPRTFNIGGIDHVDLIAIPELVKRNAEYLPTIHYNSVSVNGDEYEEKLRANQVDLVIDVEAPSQPQLQMMPVFHRRVIPTVRKGHPIAAKKLKQEALLNLKFAILSHRNVSSTAAVEASLKEHGCLDNVAVRVSHVKSIFEIVCNSDLVGFFPAETAEQYKDQLAALDIDIPPMEITHYMIWHEFQAEDPGHRWLRQQVMDIYENAENLPDTNI